MSKGVYKDLMEKKVKRQLLVFSYLTSRNT